MTRLAKALLCVLVLGVWAGVLNAQAISEQQKAKNKLLALRAARADAMRKLGERIKGLSITSETRVRDFVTESDTIETAMGAWLAGMREKSEPKFMEDGTCELTLEVTLNEVVVNLKQIHNRYYKGTRFKAEDFEKMTVTNQTKVISETGMGAVREELAADEGMEISDEAPVSSFRYLAGAAKDYWMKHSPGRGRLMAVQAARRDAQRRLAERIKGVFITSETTVRDFVAESDQIDVSMDAFLKGARETRIRYHDQELVVEVEMQVKLRTFYATLKEWGSTHYKGEKVKVRQFEELIVKSKDKVIKETGMGVPPKQYLKGVSVEVEAVMQTARNAPEWISRTLKAVGNAAVPADVPEGQGKLLAYRAAELDARRKLAEQLHGLRITSNTSVRDFVAQNDQIETAMLTFQQAAHVVEGSQKLLPDGTAEAEVEIDLKPLWDVIIYWQRKLAITIK